MRRQASDFSSPEAVRILLAAGADPNAKRDDGATALIMAAQKGRAEVVEALINGDADVNAKTSPEGYTALILASQNGYSKVVQALLSAGADVNAKRYDGATALKMASQNEHKDVVRLLQDAGAK